MSRWLSHWGLSEAPFTKEISDADLWVPTARAAAIERLVATCHERGHAVLAGEPGVGKTCVLRALRHRLPEVGFRLTYCHNVTLGRRDFYRHVCLALGLSPKATAAAVFYAISTHIAELGRENVHPVLLIDEAHLLHQDGPRQGSCRLSRHFSGRPPSWWRRGAVG
jgi:general secretion pathway protein A